MIILLDNGVFCTAAIVSISIVDARTNPLLWSVWLPTISALPGEEKKVISSSRPWVSSKYLSATSDKGFLYNFLRHSLKIELFSKYRADKALVIIIPLMYNSYDLLYIIA